MIEPKDVRGRDAARREYRNGRLRVTWEPELCLNAMQCVKNLPEVFNARKRPWVNLDGAAPEMTAFVVGMCPSGALKSEALD